MRATGIVRCSDDLGRLVIPKEIRRAIGAETNQPYEFYVTKEGEIVLRKFEVSKEVEE